ncbi:MAG: phosphatase PAP2 family protein [Deltaproteobacteria bacterium]|nr:phosphatase PAP2 family protein [Deltaproteobacteria bacterium]
MEGLVKKTAITAVITAIIYLVLFFFLDRAIDIWVHNYFSKTFILQLGTYISFLAKGDFVKLALAFCFIIIILCDPCIKWRWTRYLLYICITGSIAIIIGDGFKYLLGRYRPIMLFEHNLYGMHFFSSEWALNSTPSGHTIRAFSIFTAASFLYRRFTVVFISIATLIGASRVIVTAHYPSDVLFGAFIGIFTAAWTYKYYFIKANGR